MYAVSHDVVKFRGGVIEVSYSMGGVVQGGGSSMG